MNISASAVKELRDKTGAGILDCKEALAATQGELDKAIEYLRKKGLARAQKRADRATSEGLIGCYIHSTGKIGVLVEVNCETDFVARTDQFKELCKNLAMQVAASSPRFVSPGDIPADVAAKEKEILRAQAKESRKPDAVVEKMVEGRFRKFVTEVCLLEQPYIRDPEVSVRDVIETAIARLGENIRVRRFVRFELGEDIASAS